ncbi:aldehyde dehydrogenase family protein [Pusillimonas sp. MFBS29]|uniref:acylating sulfoacetaldehyde dehydrogenase n=1 Tax=Pusillimonas sp. MFBS29 TaxID=2886690 RepID=UPI001D0FF18D|nr:aldehyde dehydrogenase family protein [Pusillimonas sp. MFBS29]MCC2597234.1 aldehyde dehydrogenase family protein [Pusillimonas sp. MFBS29]
MQKLPSDLPLRTDDEAMAQVAELVQRARHAQQAIDHYTQQQADDLAVACGWAIMEPDRNRKLAELAVHDTGLGNVQDKITKNHRKTLGLLRDLQRARTVGVVSESPELGLIEFARPVGVVAAITPSTNPGATPANKIINALKCRNAVIVAPSPKGVSTCRMLLGYIHDELERTGMDRDLAEGLVQMLPSPVSKALTHALMMQADLVVATGSQANVRAAYLSGTPAFGVGAGNVASIVDATADLKAAAERIMLSKTFDNATSCSSENSVIVDESVVDQFAAEFARLGGVLLDAEEKTALQATMWPEGKLSAAVTGKSAGVIASTAGLQRPELTQAKALLVEEDGFGPDHPFSGEKLSPVLTLYRSRDRAHAVQIVASIYAYQGAGHSVSLHIDPAQADAPSRHLAEALPVARVIVNQPHTVATGGSFENGLPFSLSMGCGTWGGNNFSSNMDYRQYLNTTRVVFPIAGSEPTEEQIFGSFFDRFGR